MATSGADTTSAWQPGQPTNSTIFNASAFQANQLDRHAQPIWQTSAPQFPSSGFTAAMQSEARLTGSAPAALEGYEQFQGFAAVPSCQLPFTFSATTPSTEPQVPALVGLQGQPDFKLNPAGNKDVASTSGTVAVKEEQPMSRFKKHRLKSKGRMADMELEVEAKLRELQLLAAENEQLKTRSQVLEKVIFVRDWHLSLLENYGPPAFKQPDDRALDASPAALAKATNSLADNGYSPLLVKNVSECEATPAWKKAFTIPLPRPKTGHFTSAMPHLEAEYVAAFNQKVAEVPETVMQMFKSMPLPEVVKQWKEFIDKASKLLLELESYPNCPEVLEKIRVMVNMMGFSCMNVGVLNPDVMARFSYLNMDDGKLQDSHLMDDHWLHTLDMLELSECQEAQTLAVFELCARDLLKVDAVRHTLLKQWRAVMEEPGTDLNTVQDGDNASPSMEELMSRIQAIFKKEYSILVLLTVTFQDQILNIVQLTKLVVHAYPFFSNVLTMCFMLAKKRGFRARVPLGTLPAV
eukprot:jgi/Chrzof1/5718/Cz16g12270.t1